MKFKEKKDMITINLLECRIRYIIFNYLCGNSDEYINQFCSLQSDDIMRWSTQSGNIMMKYEEQRYFRGFMRAYEVYKLLMLLTRKTTSLTTTSTGNFIDYLESNVFTEINAYKTLHGYKDDIKLKVIVLGLKRKYYSD